MSMSLHPGLPDRADGGRLGGAPPAAIENHPLLATHRYVLTLPADCAAWTGGNEVSVVLRAGFSIADDDIVYPDMAMRAIVHAPSPRAVLADGHRFLFQVDEDGWPVDGELEDVVEEYLWGYGSVYFYGTPGADGTVRDVVAGFIDF